MQHLGSDNVFPGLWRGKEKQTAFVHSPLMNGTMVSHNSGILSQVSRMVALEIDSLPL